MSWSKGSKLGGWRELGASWSEGSELGAQLEQGEQAGVSWSEGSELGGWRAGSKLEQEE